MLGPFREIWQRVAAYRAAGRALDGTPHTGGFLFAASPSPSCSACWTSRADGVAGRGTGISCDVRPTEFGEALVKTIYRKAARPPDSSPPRGRAGFWGLATVVPGVLPRVARNLAFPEPERRDGVFVFKAKLGSIWRRIAIPAECDLDALAWAIIREFKFDGDHLYDFRFPGRDGSPVRVVCPYIDDAEAWTDDYSIGDLPLAEGQSMEFEYDYGTSWRFDVKLEKVEPPNPRMKKPKLVESHGTAPRSMAIGRSEGPACCGISFADRV